MSLNYDSYNLIGGRCKKKYPLVENIKDIEGIINKIFPIEIVGGQAYENIMQINDILISLSSDSTIQYYSEEIVQLVASVVAAAVSAGAGGDMIVSAFFTLRHGLAMATKIIGMVDNIKKRIVSETINEEGIKEISYSPETLQFIGDFFNISFEDGPEGVECWVDAIFKKYKKQQISVIMCDIIADAQLFETLGQFVANFIASSIPDAGYLVKKSIEKLMQSKMVRKVVMMNVMSRFKKNYRKIPKNIRKMIQKPEIFEKLFMEKYFLVRNEFTSKKYPIKEINVQKIGTIKKNDDKKNNEQQGGFLFKYGQKQLLNVKSTLGSLATSGVGFVAKKSGAGDKIFEKVDPIASQSKLISYTIHKMLALSYAILCILRRCP